MRIGIVKLKLRITNYELRIWIDLSPPRDFESLSHHREPQPPKLYISLLSFVFCPLLVTSRATVTIENLSHHREPPSPEKYISPLTIVNSSFVSFNLQLYQLDLQFQYIQILKNHRKTRVHEVQCFPRFYRTSFVIKSMAIRGIE